MRLVSRLNAPPSKLKTGATRTIEEGAPDTNDWVIGADGQPMPGLHAIGNCAASAMGESYPGAGVTIGPALTFGYIAGRTAALANA